MAKGEGGMKPVCDRPKTENIAEFDVIAREIANVVFDVTGIRITDYESNISGVGVDSLSLLDILSVLETEFGILLVESVVDEFYSVSRTARVVQDALRSQGAQAPDN